MKKTTGGVPKWNCACIRREEKAGLCHTVYDSTLCGLVRDAKVFCVPGCFQPVIAKESNLPW